jgi:hypothetical protein
MIVQIWKTIYTQDWFFITSVVMEVVTRGKENEEENQEQ